MIDPTWRSKIGRGSASRAVKLLSPTQVQRTIKKEDADLASSAGHITTNPCVFYHQLAAAL